VALAVAAAALELSRTDVEVRAEPVVQILVPAAVAVVVTVVVRLDTLVLVELDLLFSVMLIRRQLSQALVLG
jgi:hypothetical protein